MVIAGVELVCRDCGDRFNVGAADWRAQKHARDEGHVVEIRRAAS